MSITWTIVAIIEALVLWWYSLVFHSKMLHTYSSKRDHIWRYIIEKTLVLWWYSLVFHSKMLHKYSSKRDHIWRYIIEKITSFGLCGEVLSFTVSEIYFYLISNLYHSSQGNWECHSTIKSSIIACLAYWW